MKCWTNLGDSLVKHRNVPIFSSAHCVISKHFGPKELRAKQRERAVCSLRLSVASNYSRHWVVALSFQLRTGTGKDYHKKPIGQAGIIFLQSADNMDFAGWFAPGFMSGLAMKRDVGQASTRLREEETYAPRQAGR